MCDRRDEKEGARTQGGSIPHTLSTGSSPQGPAITERHSPPGRAPDKVVEKREDEAEEAHRTSAEGGEPGSFPAPPE